MKRIMDEKVEQAVDLLRELDIDLWLTFVRENLDGGDPAVPLICDFGLCGQSALIITKAGERIAVTWEHDADALINDPTWTEVIPYGQGISQSIVETLHRLDPNQIALNYSVNDPKSDGLTYGMLQLLNKYLADTPYPSRFISAENIVGKLRARKTKGEIDRIRTAIKTTSDIFAAAARFAAVGKTERQVAEFMKNIVRQQHLGFAWSEPQCPIVNTGPNSPIGHSVPSDLVIQPGHILHIDFGVLQNDYCSDLQRCWYVPRTGDSGPTGTVQRGFDTVVMAISAAAEALKPGVLGWQVDEAARNVVISAGYEEYTHATGHHVGKSAHDGSGVLGPRWERYGQMPYVPVEEGNVVTLELGIEKMEECGYIGLEEMVVVTADGCEFLSQRQEELWTLPK